MRSTENCCHWEKVMIVQWWLLQCPKVPTGGKNMKPDTAKSSESFRRSYLTSAATFVLSPLLPIIAKVSCLLLQMRIPEFHRYTSALVFTAFSVPTQSASNICYPSNSHTSRCSINCARLALRFNLQQVSTVRKEERNSQNNSGVMKHWWPFTGFWPCEITIFITTPPAYTVLWDSDLLIALFSYAIRAWCGLGIVCQ